MTYARWGRVAAMAAAVTLLAIAVPVHAQQDKRDHASVAGRWTVSLSGPHKTALQMALEQDKTTVKGSIDNPHGGVFQLTGTFVDRKLALATSTSDLELTAELKDDGTLAGMLSGARGDFEWTAKRAAGSR